LFHHRLCLFSRLSGHLVLNILHLTHHLYTHTSMVFIFIFLYISYLIHYRPPSTLTFRLYIYCITISYRLWLCSPADRPIIACADILSRIVNTVETTPVLFILYIFHSLCVCIHYFTHLSIIVYVQFIISILFFSPFVCIIADIVSILCKITTTTKTADEGPQRA